MNGKEFIEMIQARKNPNQGAHRIEKLLEIARESGVNPDGVTVVINRDWKWNRRRNRTKNEAGAIKIGQTNSKTRGFADEIVWAYVESED